MTRSEPNDDTPPADEEAPAPASPDTHSRGKKPEPLAAAKKEAADAYDRYLRAVADLENFRRRSVREKEDLRLFAASRVLEDLLPIMDNLALGMAAAKQPKADLKSLSGGIEMVLQQLKSLLANHGLKEINPLGQHFDPHQQEAISHQPSDEVKAEDVLTVVRTGYVLNGRLLRPASVILSGGPSGGAKPEASR